MFNTYEVDVYDQMENQIYDAVEEWGKNKWDNVIYSAYKTDSEDNPINNLQEEAVSGKCKLIGYNDSCWGKGSDYESPILDSPSWLQVAVYCNDMIAVTGDRHHVFLEGLDLIKTENGINYFEFCMGS